MDTFRSQYTSVFLGLFFLGTCMCGTLPQHSDVPLCCLPSEFQASLLVDFGIVFIDANTAYSYINGSATLGFSLSRGKIYIGLNGTELSPLIPKPEPYDSIMLYDFDKKMMYTVQGGECQKSSLEQAMTTQCIPRDAKKLSSGVISPGSADALMVQTFQWSLSSDVPWQITATVYMDERQAIEHKSCQPLHVKYFAGSANPDSGSLYGLDIQDSGPITTPDIFDVPKPCQ